MGAKNTFNELFKTFQNSEFFKDALYDFSWTEKISGGIDRLTGHQIVSTIDYHCAAFLISPSKAERPSQSMFRDFQVGDIMINVRQEELIKAPPLNHVVVFNGKNYTCKEILPDSAGVSWKMLLRS